MRGGGGTPAVLVHELGQVPAEHLLDGVAEHLGHPGVDEGGPRVGVDRPDALVGEFDDAPVARLAVVQRLLDPPAFGDVLDLGDEASGRCRRGDG